MHTKVVFSEDARNALLKGLNVTADAVGCTLGPNGKTVLIQDGDSMPIVTKDGVTVSKSIKLKDTLERMGSSLIQEAASRTNEVAGDGTTTATILTHAMVSQGVRMLNAGLSALSLKRGLESSVRLVDQNLMAMAVPIKGSTEIEQVATVSANGDSHIGRLISHAMERVGRTGVITVEDAKGMNTSVDLVEGMQFDRGYVSPYFVNDHEKMIASYENAYVLVVDHKLDELSTMIPLLDRVLKSGTPLLIIADEIEGTALQGLVLNRHKANLPVVAIRSPGYGEHRSDLLNDICALTGATLVSNKSGNDLKTATLQTLGTLQRVIVSKTTTTLVSNGKQKEQIELLVKNLETQLLDVTLNSQQIEKLQRRIAGLASGVAIIKVGGTTEIEMIERKYRIEDALHATKAASDEGIIPGGGLALFRSINDLKNIVIPEDEPDVESFKAGVRIVAKACETPFRRITENAGFSFESLSEKVPSDKNTGYDARNGEFVNMFQKGIIDPVKVTRAALNNAASVAATFLTLDAVVAVEEEKTDDQ